MPIACELIPFSLPLPSFLFLSPNSTLLAVPIKWSGQYFKYLIKIGWHHFCASPFSPPATPTLLQPITLKLIPSPLQLLLLHTYECKCTHVHGMYLGTTYCVCFCCSCVNGFRVDMVLHFESRIILSGIYWITGSDCSQRTDLLENGPIPLSHDLKFWLHQVYGSNGCPSPLAQLVWHKQVTEPFLAHLVQQIRW